MEHVVANIRDGAIDAMAAQINGSAENAKMRSNKGQQGPDVDVIMASYKKEMSIELRKKCLVDIPGLLVHMDIWTYHITSLGHKYPRFPCHVDTSLPNSDGRLDEVKT